MGCYLRITLSALFGYKSVLKFQVISLHLGVVINVPHVWENFKAANTAFQQTLSVAIAKKLSAANISAFKAIEFPHSAKLSLAEFVPCQLLIANANQRLRWIVLHSCNSLIELFFSFLQVCLFFFVFWCIRFIFKVFCIIPLFSLMLRHFF